MTVSRNSLMAIILVFAAGLAIVGYALYEEKQQPSGVEIKIGEGGISIEEK